MSQNPLQGSGFSGSTVFRKTRRGYAEIAQETQILSNSLRRFLVFVDGTRTLDKLVEITQVLGDTRAALAELIRDGFITADETTGTFPAVPVRTANVSPLPGIPMPSAPTPVQQPMPAPAAVQRTAPQVNMAAPAYPLDQVKNYMLSDLRTRMGKDAELVAPKILAARSNEDLIVMMMRLRDILTKYSGSEDAEQFVKKFKDMLI